MMNDMFDHGSGGALPRNLLAGKLELHFEIPAVHVAIDLPAASALSNQ